MSQGKGADAGNSTNKDQATLPGNAETKDGKVELKRSRAWIPCSFLVLAIFSSVGVAIGWHFRIRNLDVKGGPSTNSQGRIVRRFNGCLGKLWNWYLTLCRLNSLRIWSRSIPLQGILFSTGQYITIHPVNLLKLRLASTRSTIRHTLLVKTP